MAKLRLGRRLVCRASVEERMMQQAKRKLVLEHLVVQNMGRENDLRQEELDDIIRFGTKELFAEFEAEKAAAAPDLEEVGLVSFL